MKYLKQLRSLLIHKWFVLIAGRRLGLPLWRLLAHDLSKFSPVELVNYAHWFFGEKNKQGWARAWLHHQHRNKHHPEHWVLAWRGDEHFYDGIGESLVDYVTVLPMPEIYVREMVADWMAASKTYTGSWDISAWFNQEAGKMRLHSKTRERLYNVLSEIDIEVAR